MCKELAAARGRKFLGFLDATYCINPPGSIQSKQIAQISFREGKFRETIHQEINQKLTARRDIWLTRVKTYEQVDGSAEITSRISYEVEAI